MVERAFSWLLLLALPAIVVGQDPGLAPHPVPAAAERPLNQELRRLIASRDALTLEIERLSKVTGQHQHVLVSVQVCELSLTKVGNADFKADGVDLNSLRASGFAAALAAGEMDPRLAEELRRVQSGVAYRVLDSDDGVKKLIAELQQVGVLKVLAEPTLATVSGRPATWLSGGECPIPVGQTNEGPKIQFKAFGTQLYLLPTVLSQERVRLQVRPEISEMDLSHSVTVGNMTVPAFHVRGGDTSVEMNFGQTFLLSGLRQKRAIPEARAESAEADQTKPPGPNEFEETELIFVVRAEMLDAPQM